MARATRVATDLGTGDGRAVLARARRELRTLVIGIDASAAAMADASLRAARPTRKGGLANAVFLVAAAEALPEELRSRADEVTILFPWGSLLRAVLAREDAGAGACGIASLVGAGGTVRALVSIDARDRLGLAPLTAGDAPALAARWAAHGFELTRFAPAEPADIDASGSSWGRRLAAGRDRVTWRLELRCVERPRPELRRRESGTDPSAATPSHGR